MSNTPNTEKAKAPKKAKAPRKVKATNPTFVGETKISSESIEAAAPAPAPAKPKKDRITELTPEMEAKLPIIRDFWIKEATTHKDVKLEDVEADAKWVYELCGFKAPDRVYIADGPQDGQYMANFGEEWEAKLKEGASHNYLASCIGSSHSSYWLAFYGFFNDELELDYQPFVRGREFVKKGVWEFIAMENHCVIVTGPKYVKTDAEGRPHCVDGPAICWPNGEGYYFLHGIGVDFDLVDNPEKITLKRIMEEGNVEVRRVLIELKGYDAIFEEANPKTLDEDVDGGGQSRKLLRIEFKERGEETDEPLTVVCVEDPSTGRKYHLRVPPDSKTCKEAVAWTFGERPESYAPRLEA